MVCNAPCHSVTNGVTNDVTNGVSHGVGYRVQTRPDQTVLTFFCSLSLVQFIFNAKERNARDPIGLAR